ncbi:MAG: Rrf2 family transcriptional regulator [Deltaproteobacteria bacterium]|nr:Rrf2 family transcriptional regulator [Deltaproteobacteria bacterium]
MTRTCYSTLALLEVARGGSRRPVALHAIARRQAIPERILKTLFKRMRSAGLVRGVRGARGGYTLAKKPEETSLLDVVSAVRVNGHDTELVAGRNNGGQSRTPHRAWNRLDQAMSSMFESISLADLSDAPGRQIRRALNHRSEQ